MNLRFLAVLVMVGSLLTCGKDAESGLSETDQQPAIDFKRTDNEVRVALLAEPTGIHPLLTTQSLSRYVSEQVFQTINDQDPQTFAQVPLLASVADITEEANGTVSYAYTIDPAAEWPNGLPVTAQDVVFSLKALLNPLVNAGPYRSYYSMISNVVTSPSNEKKFRVITKRPYVIAEQAIGSLWVYPEYAYDPEGWMRNVRLTDLTDPNRAERLAESSNDLKQFADFFNDTELGLDPEKIVGSGPYRVAEWQTGQRIRLERQDNYWAADREEEWLEAEPDALEFEIITDANTVGNALRDESIDAVVSLAVDQFQEFRKDEYLSARYDFLSVPSFNYFGILFNQRDPLLSDAKTRQALAYSVNVDQIVEQLFPGLAERVVGPVLPHKTYFNDALEPIPFDPDRAASLLAEAGWEDTNGNGIVDKEIDGERRELSFPLLSFPSPTSEAVAVIAAEGARAAGVDIEVVKQEPRAMMGELNKGNFVASVFGQGSFPAPDDFTQTWASTSVPPNGSNRGGFSDPEADRILARIARTTDAEARTPLYRRFQEIIYENQPAIFLFSPSDRVVVSKRFTFTPTSMSPNVNFNALELK